MGESGNPYEKGQGGKREVNTVPSSPSPLTIRGILSASQPLLCWLGLSAQPPCGSQQSTLPFYLTTKTGHTPDHRLRAATVFLPQSRGQLCCQMATSSKIAQMGGCRCVSILPVRRRFGWVHRSWGKHGWQRALSLSLGWGQ